MRFSRFFIDRPIFAIVLSLVILAGGLIAVTQLPISEYPEVTPPTITVSAIYPGANPSVLAHGPPHPALLPPADHAHLIKAHAVTPPITHQSGNNTNSKP